LSLLINTYLKLENQFRVINRVTRDEQIFNSKEISKFFHCEYDPQTKKVKYMHQWNDYAISTIKPEKEKLLDNIVISVVAVAIIVCLTKLIMLWI
tara:strand:- start:163 stop:447 length:285 start_codon:yes stop_codon:yes gene_type:complete